MRRRGSVSLQPIPAPPPQPPGARRRTGGPPARGLRSVSDLPPRAKAFLVLAALVIVGFAVWVTVRLFEVDARGIAIVLVALSYVGAVVVAVAVVTLTRIVCSVGALPYLLGRGLRRLLARRR